MIDIIDIKEVTLSSYLLINERFSGLCPFHGQDINSKDLRAYMISPYLKFHFTKIRNDN